MATRYWLVKQEPEAYPWSQLVADHKTAWTSGAYQQYYNSMYDNR